MDDEHLGEGATGFRALFGDLDEPFARLYKALRARIDLFVGIPAGPLHFTMARGGVPTIGLWLAHHPDWYDEPNPDAIHLIGRYVRDRGFDRRPATTTKPPSLHHRLCYLDTERDRCRCRSSKRRERLSMVIFGASSSATIDNALNSACEIIEANALRVR